MYLIIRQSQLGNTFVNSTGFFFCKTNHESTSTYAVSGINPVYDTIAICSFFIHVLGGRGVQSVEKCCLHFEIAFYSSV